jgi:anaerobic selenocysteine-containing dehydrogenase
MSLLGRELLTRADPPVRVLFVWAGTPAVSNPDQGRTRTGLARDDLFTVVVDHVLTDTARYADLVLPGTTQLEHQDLHSSYSHLYLHWNRPAVDPPGGCLPHTEIFRRLAAALGLTEPALYASDTELAAAALGGGHPALAGITVESLQADGWVRLGWPKEYLPFAERFATPSGRFEFDSARGAADGAGRYPSYHPPHRVGRPPEPGPDGTLELISAANHYLLNSTFAASPRHTRRGEPTVLLHPADAAARGIVDGALVRLGNQVGSFTARAALTDAVRRGVAATTKGHGTGPDAAGVNAVVADSSTDLGEAATFHDTRVSVHPITPESADQQGSPGAVRGSAPSEDQAHRLGPGRRLP